MTSPAQGVNIGNAQGSITLSPEGVSAGVAEAKKQITNFIQDTGRSLQNWGTEISNIGFALGKALAPATLAGGAALKIAGDFDMAMTEIQARTGLTNEAMDEIAQTSKDLGAATIFSSQQVADAFLQMLTAGMDTEQALAALPAVLDAAAAGNYDLGLAADGVTNVLAVFNLEADETRRVVDALSAASASSPATMLQLQEAMSLAGGTAESLGISVEDTSAILALFANRNIRGAEAGRAFNSMIRNMTSDVSKAPEAWKELGISLFDAQGNMRDLNTVFDELNVALNKLPMKDQNRLVQELAGSEGKLAFQALLAGEGIDSMREKMDSQRSASEIAADMMEAFNNQVNSLIGSIGTLGLEVITPFMNDVLLPLIKRGIENVNMLSEWAKNNQALVKTIVTVIAVLAAVAAGLVAFGQVLIVIGGLIAALTSPIGLVVLAVGALAAAFATDFLGIRTKLQPVIDWIVGVLDRLWFTISVFFSDLQNFGLAEAIRGIFGIGSDERAESTLEGLLFTMGFSREEAIRITGDVLNVFTAWFPRIRNFFIRAFAVIQNVLARAWAIIGTIFSSNPFDAMFNLIKAGFSSEQAQAIVSYFWTLRNVIGNVFQAISDAWTNTLKPAFDELFAAFSATEAGDGGFDLFAAGINATTWLLQTFGTVITQFVIPVVAQLIAWFAQFVAWIVTNLPVAETAWNQLMFLIVYGLQVASTQATELAITILTGIQNAAITAGQAWELFKLVIIGALATAYNTLVSWWSQAQTIFQSVLDWITATWNVGWESVKTFFITLWAGIQTGIENVKTGIQTGLQAVIDWITNTWNTAWSTFTGFFSGLWSAVSGGIETFKTGIQTAFNWIKTTVIDPIITAVNNLLGLFNEAKNLAGEVGSAANNLITNPGGTAGQAANNAQSLLSQAGQIAKLGIQNLIPHAQGTNFVPQVTPALLHPGEAVFPAQYNPFNPNAETNGMQGNKFEITIENINATSAADGAKAGEAFGDKLMERLLAHGII